MISKTKNIPTSFSLAISLKRALQDLLVFVSVKLE